jgi:hypothetical protein
LNKPAKISTSNTYDGTFSFCAVVVGNGVVILSSCMPSIEGKIDKLTWKERKEKKKLVLKEARKKKRWNGIKNEMARRENLCMCVYVQPRVKERMSRERKSYVMRVGKFLHIFFFFFQSAILRRQMLKNWNQEWMKKKVLKEVGKLKFFLLYFATFIFLSDEFIDFFMLLMFRDEMPQTNVFWKCFEVVRNGILHESMSMWSFLLGKCNFL